MGIKIAFVYGRNWYRISASGQSRGEECRCLYIDGVDRSGRLLLADTSKVKGDKEKKNFNIEPMMDEFLAIGTMKTVLMGLATSNY